MSRTLNPFGDLAAGYATDRPPMHARVVARVRDDLAARLPCGRAVDVGCGTGLSTAPLVPLAGECIGLEPVAAMLASARALAPDAHFVKGAAEQMPFAPASIELVTAAGSLNFTRVPEALAEIRRVLTRDGVLVAYDWATARDFTDDGALDAWFAAFEARYPRPPSEAVFLDPPTLAAMSNDFDLDDATSFAWPLEMTAERYARYMLTETRVAAAIRRGEAREAIGAWCRETLAEVFGERVREVLFKGYVAYLRPC